MKKNVFLILFAALLTLILNACGSGAANTTRSESTAAAPANTGQYLGDFQAIPGTNYLYAAISQKPNGGALRNLVSSISSSEDYGNITNLVFLDDTTLSSHKLFATNDQVIVSAVQFPDPDNGTSGSGAVQQAQAVQPARSNLMVRWLVYQIAARAPSSNDEVPFSIAVTDAGGNGYKELLSGVTKTYGMNMISDQLLLVVYAKNNVKTASVLDLAKRTVTESNAIVDLGAGVQ